MSLFVSRCLTISEADFSPSQVPICGSGLCGWAGARRYVEHPQSIPSLPVPSLIRSRPHMHCCNPLHLLYGLQVFLAFPVTAVDVDEQNAATCEIRVSAKAGKRQEKTGVKTPVSNPLFPSPTSMVTAGVSHGV